MSIICNMWTRRIVNANPAVAWRNASIIHRRYAQAFSKGENGKFTQISGTKENPKSKDAPTNLQKRSHATSIKGETQMFSTVKGGRNLLNPNQRQDLLLFITRKES
ncbi:uncharacterized protein LOC131029296 isoform X1 [Cryptomeria japonica]|uniref:uncharacterized protein LOC131029296 isoform X1 n=1 Tax=Cryptomeria japonica TaxID=3369 RepID=UPI0025AC4B8A|nr:uncharacterized protein LOC131029296 isoform X1 [Cryptomeria japonica]